MIRKSDSLKQLDNLLETNQQFFAENADAEFAKEKQVFDMKCNKGRFAYIVRRRESYKGMIDSLNQADQHMKQVIEQATNLRERVF